MKQFSVKVVDLINATSNTILVFSIGSSYIRNNYTWCAFQLATFSSSSSWIDNETDQLFGSFPGRTNHFWRYSVFSITTGCNGMALSISTTFSIPDKSRVIHITQGLRKLIDQPNCNPSTDWEKPILSDTETDSQNFKPKNLANVKYSGFSTYCFIWVLIVQMYSYSVELLQ